MKTCLVLFFLCIGLNATAQQSQVTIEAHIAKFKGDRKAALCFSFDDGLYDQYTLALPMLEKFGFHGTFFVIPGVVVANDTMLLNRKEGAWGGISWTKLHEMARHGHEIASHSWSHQNMRTLSDRELNQEIDRADSMIVEKIGMPPLTFAYPFNAFNARLHNAVYARHLAAREKQYPINAHFTSDQGKVWVDELIQKHDWGITMIHGIAVGYDALLDPRQLEAMMAYASQMHEEVWVATFAEISAYNQQRDAVSLIVNQTSKGAKFLFQRTALPANQYPCDLTIVLSVPAAVNFKVWQRGKHITVTRSGDKALIDVRPFGGAVRLQWE